MTKNTRDMGLIVVFGRISLLGLWFLATLLIVRTLAKSEFGFYVYCTSLIKLFTSFINNTLDIAVLRSAPVLLQEDRSRAIGLCRTSLWLRLGAASAISIPLILLAPFIASTFLDDASRSNLIILTAFGIIGDVLVRAAMIYLQSESRFGRFLFVEGSLQVCRFGAIAALVFSGCLSSGSALLTYVMLSYGAFGLALLLLPRDVYGSVPSGRREIAETLKFSAWIIMALALAAFSERLDLFAIGYFRDAGTMAVYGAALVLATIPEFIEGSLNTILMPMVSATQKNGQFRDLHMWYVKRAAIPCSLLAIGVLAVGDWGTVMFLSQKYVAAVPVFKIQIIGAMVWLAIAPIPSALVAFVSPRAMLTINGAGLGARAVACAILIPWLGAPGAGIIFLGMKVAMTIAVTAFAYSWQRKTHEVSKDASAEQKVIEAVLVAEGGTP